MKVRVQFFSQLRDIAGTPGFEMDVPENSTVRDLLATIYEQRPALRSLDRSLLIGAGIEFVDREYQLKRDDEISIMPPVQGG